ncbi:MAG TPA: hypothetical protein VEG30_00045 [Terriglobales bacterium]|nr:hypothetical protein [Terriglobales bacterium]
MTPRIRLGCCFDTGIAGCTGSALEEDELGASGGPAEVVPAGGEVSGRPGAGWLEDRWLAVPSAVRPADSAGIEGGSAC